MNQSFFIKIALALAVGLAIGYFLGYDHGFEHRQVSTFDQCLAAGYPVMESHPRQCRTPDGRNFVEQIDDDQIYCTADAKLCPDGSYVGRKGPNCEFAPCP